MTSQSIFTLLCIKLGFGTFRRTSLFVCLSIYGFIISQSHIISKKKNRIGYCTRKKQRFTSLPSKKYKTNSVHSFYNCEHINEVIVAGLDL